MNSKHTRTLRAIHTKPTPATVKWSDVEALFTALGSVTQGNGSRVRVVINEVRAVFHQPHPENTCGKSMVRSIATFLSDAGV